MINDQKDNLFQLIKSLTKSEKRQFKLYVGRMGSNNNAKFLYPFDPVTERIVGAAAAKQIPIKVPASLHFAILI